MAIDYPGSGCLFSAQLFSRVMVWADGRAVVWTPCGWAGARLIAVSRAPWKAIVPPERVVHRPGEQMLHTSILSR